MHVPTNKSFLPARHCWACIGEESSNGDVHVAAWLQGMQECCTTNDGSIINLEAIVLMSGLILTNQILEFKHLW